MWIATASTVLYGKYCMGLLKVCNVWFIGPHILQISSKIDICAL